MSHRNRLSVLLSAFACEPGIGSEPEVGWQWALQMARFHDLTVLTQSKNQPAIEQGLAALRGRQPEPRFVYHSLSPRVQRLRQHSLGFKVHYMLWQKSARELIARRQAEHRYDLMHHVTFAGYRYPTAIWGHRVPCIWGPIGGIESIPFGLLPWRHPASLVQEGTRNAHNFIHATRFSPLAGRARASTLILVTTGEMQQALARLGFATEVVPTIGLRTASLPWQPHRVPDGPLKLLFVGNVISLKGIDLALEALKESGTQATLTLAGDGAYLKAAKELTAKLGIQIRVIFTGRLPRRQVLELYPNYDLFVFPSLHDTGGYAMIEAMFNQLPVLCLDCGGPAVAVREHCGIKVSLGPRRQVIAGLAAAMRWYDQNRAALLADGRAARETILRYYDWDRKAEQMNEYYLAVVRQSGTAPVIASAR